MRRGVFVTGTDTGVGKTVVSAALMHAFRAIGAIGVVQVSDPEIGVGESRDREFANKTPPSTMGSDTCTTPMARYWKPIQTGIEQDDDTAEVRRLGACSADEILDRGVRLPRPLSPHLAARLHSVRISLDDVLACANLESPDADWVVEGAGGALVPINESVLMIDLMVRLALPVVIAARTALGTINHTLLTIDALRTRALTVAGVVLVGERNDENRLAIETYGHVRILGEMPRFNPLTPETLGAWAREHIDLGRSL